MRRLRPFGRAPRKWEVRLVPAIRGLRDETRLRPKCRSAGGFNTDHRAAQAGKRAAAIRYFGAASEIREPYASTHPQSARLTVPYRGSPTPMRSSSETPRASRFPCGCGRECCAARSGAGLDGASNGVCPFRNPGWATNRDSPRPFGLQFKPSAMQFPQARWIMIVGQFRLVTASFRLDAVVHPVSALLVGHDRDDFLPLSRTRLFA